MTITIRKTAGLSRSAKNGNPFKRSGETLAVSFLLFPLLGIRRVRKTLLGRGLVMLLLVAAGLAADGLASPAAARGTASMGRR